MRLALVVMAVLVASCAPPTGPVAERAVAVPTDLPPMKVFSAPSASRPVRANSAIAQDFLDLSFQLESGRQIETFTRFEEPVRVRLTGAAPRRLSQDLDRLVARLRNEASIDISRVAPDIEAEITIEMVSRDAMRRAVPQAACFVVPRLSDWRSFDSNRRSAELDWTTLARREKVAIFVPTGVSPQEMRDCLHEELAQSLGPLNDLYRLTDSVFNDDNFHTVLTGFDMLILRATYAPELRSGMTRAQVAERLPAILDRINPQGRQGVAVVTRPAPRAWIDAIENALGPRASASRRVAAAKRAVRIAREQGWTDNRAAFSLFALGRLVLPSDPELAFTSFVESAGLYHADPSTHLHAAHVAMQLSAFALSAGDARAVLDLVDPHLDAVARAENAALLAQLLMVRAEALDMLGRTAEADEARSESLGWARYGFGTDAVVRARAAEIAALTPPPMERL
ncbi:DUF2927 domain-containing protein [Roseitranquillus sediminis]|uniref:DUF2927 domain-containing protein n=1 Tax=Roseitranquillus sediminis TaxID=2809051 RepID=UPI003872EEE2